LFEQIIGLTNKNINFATRVGMKNIERTAHGGGLSSFVDWEVEIFVGQFIEAAEPTIT